MKRVSDIVGMNVVNSKGSPVGEVERVLCSRTRGRVMGIILKRKKFDRGNTIIHYKDILSFGDDLLIINDRSAGRSGDIKDMSLTEEGEDITGYMVLTADGKEIGVVKDTVIGETSGIIEGYMVAGDLYEDLLKGRKMLKLDKSAAVGNKAIMLDALEAAETGNPGGLENIFRLNE